MVRLHRVDLRAVQQVRLAGQQESRAMVGRDAHVLKDESADQKCRIAGERRKRRVRRDPRRLRQRAEEGEIDRRTGHRGGTEGVAEEAHMVQLRLRQLVHERGLHRGQAGNQGRAGNRDRARARAGVGRRKTRSRGRMQVKLSFDILQVESEIEVIHVGQRGWRRRRRGRGGRWGRGAVAASRHHRSGGDGSRACKKTAPGQRFVYKVDQFLFHVLPLLGTRLLLASPMSVRTQGRPNGC